MKSLNIQGQSIWVHTANRQRYDGDVAVINEVLLADVYKLACMKETVKNAKVVIDVGAHIGTFCKRLRKAGNHEAEYHGFEVCPENWPVLDKNCCGPKDHFYKMAVDYGGPKMLLNSVTADVCVATGGSIVIERDSIDKTPSNQYTLDDREIAVTTLSEILERLGIEKVDILKVDCEGAEKRILRHDREGMEKVKHVVGEWHGQDFFDIIQELYADWTLHIFTPRRGTLGYFWLFHPDRFGE